MLTILKLLTALFALGGLGMLFGAKGTSIRERLFGFGMVGGALLVSGIFKHFPEQGGSHTENYSAAPSSSRSASAAPVSSYAVVKDQRRFSRADKERFQWGGAKDELNEAARVAIASSDLLPGIKSLSVRRVHVGMSVEALTSKGKSDDPLTTYAEVAAVVTEPLEQPQIDDLAAKIRNRLAAFNGVGVRFVFDDVGDKAKYDEATASQYYAWVKVGDGEADIRMLNMPPSTAAKIAAVLKAGLKPAEKIDAMYVDYRLPNGFVALTSEGGKTYLRWAYAEGSGVDSRHLMRELRTPKALKRKLQAVHVEQASGETFKADGKGTDPVNAAIMPDGSIAIYAGSGDAGRGPILDDAKPWLIGKVYTSAEPR